MKVSLFRECATCTNTFTKADIFLPEEKINLSTGFLFLCACFNFSESQNMTQNHDRVHRWVVNMQLPLFWGGSCLTHVFSAESWSITVRLYISLSRCAGQGGCCWERLSLAARKHKSGDLECVAGQCWAGACFCNNGEPWQAPAPARLSSASTPSPTGHPAGASRACEKAWRTI